MTDRNKPTQDTIPGKQDEQWERTSHSSHSSAERNDSEESITLNDAITDEEDSQEGTVAVGSGLGIDE